MRRCVPVTALILLLSVAAAPLGAANLRLSDGQAFSDVFHSNWSQNIVVTPDGHWVFYVEDADVDEAGEVWRVPAAGGSPQRISGLLPTGAHAFERPADPGRLPGALQGPAGQPRPLRALLGAGQSSPGSYVKVNSPVPAGFFVFGPGGFSPDSQRLVYAFSAFNPVPSSTGPELWVARLDGSEQSPLVTLLAGRLVGPFASAPDFSRAVYLADAAVAGRDEIWSVPTAGGAPVKLNGALVAGGEVVTFNVSPVDGSVAYVADQQIDELYEAYPVPPGGGAVIKVSGPLGAGHDVSGVLFAAGGSRILYVEYDVAAQRVIELWSVALDGSDRVGLLGAMVAGGKVVGEGISSTHFIFVADKLVDEKFELFSVPLAGGAIQKLNATLPADGDVVYSDNALPKITPDGTRVVYVADQVSNGLDDVYSVPIGGGTPVPVGSATASGIGAVTGLVVSADGQRVARVRSYRPSVVLPTTVHLAVAPLGAGP